MSSTLPDEADALLQAVENYSPIVPDPVAERERKRLVLVGDVPSPIDPPSGCAFHTRCPHVMDRCRTETPVLEPTPDDERHRVACHLEEAPEL